MLTALLVCLISVAWPGGFVFLYLRLPDFLAQGYHTYKILLSSDHSSSPITRHVFYTQPFCWLQRSLLPLIAERARHRNVPRQQLLSFSGACCSLTAFPSLLINWTKCFCFRLCRKRVFHTEDRVFPWHGSSVNKQIFFMELFSDNVLSYISKVCSTLGAVTLSPRALPFYYEPP